MLNDFYAQRTERNIGAYAYHADRNDQRLFSEAFGRTTLVRNSQHRAGTSFYIGTERRNSGWIVKRPAATSLVSSPLCVSSAPVPRGSRRSSSKIVRLIGVYTGDHSKKSFERRLPCNCYTLLCRWRRACVVNMNTGRVYG